jgi:acyl-CoA thioesterase-1
MKRQSAYKIFIFLVMPCVLLILSCSRPEQPKESSKVTTEPAAETMVGTIVAMGDSLTAGYNLSPEEAYPAILQKLLLKEGYPYRVINAGISGETSSGALSRVEWVLTTQPDIIILETGANDGLRGIDPKVTRNNMEKIVGFFQSKKVTVLLTGMRMTPNLGLKFTQEFNQIYKNIAQKYNLILMPFFLEDVGGEPKLNLPDGIHPNQEGYRIIARNLLPYVIEAIKQREKEYVRE